MTQRTITQREIERLLKRAGGRLTCHPEAPLSAEREEIIRAASRRTELCRKLTQELARFHDCDRRLFQAAQTLVNNADGILSELTACVHAIEQRDSVAATLTELAGEKLQHAVRLAHHRYEAVLYETSTFLAADTLDELATKLKAHMPA